MLCTSVRVQSAVPGQQVTETVATRLSLIDGNSVHVLAIPGNSDDFIAFPRAILFVSVFFFSLQM